MNFINLAHEQLPPFLNCINCMYIITKMQKLSIELTHGEPVLMPAPPDIEGTIITLFANLNKVTDKNQANLNFEAPEGVLEASSALAKLLLDQIERNKTALATSPDSPLADDLSRANELLIERVRVERSALRKK